MIGESGVHDRLTSFLPSVVVLRNGRQSRRLRYDPGWRDAGFHDDAQYIAGTRLLTTPLDAMNEAAWCYLEGFGTKKDKVSFVFVFFAPFIAITVPVWLVLLLVASYTFRFANAFRRGIFIPSQLGRSNLQKEGIVRYETLPTSLPGELRFWPLAFFFSRRLDSAKAQRIELGINEVLSIPQIGCCRGAGLLWLRESRWPCKKEVNPHAREYFGS